MYKYQTSHNNNYNFVKMSKYWYIHNNNRYGNNHSHNENKKLYLYGQQVFNITSLYIIITWAIIQQFTFLNMHNKLTNTPKS